MTKHSKELLVLTMHDGETDAMHDSFCEFASAEQLKLLNTILDMSNLAKTCGSCAALSMVSTLMSNLFLRMDGGERDYQKMNEFFKKMVDRVETAARSHNAEEEKEQNSPAEVKLSAIYGKKS